MIFFGVVIKCMRPDGESRMMTKKNILCEIDHDVDAAGLSLLISLGAYADEAAE